MMAIFHDMIEKTIEVFMDDFLVFGNSFGNCLSRVDKMIQRCEDTNLCLNWEKCHFMVKEGIIFDHKISKNGIEVDKAKVDVKGSKEIAGLMLMTMEPEIQRNLENLHANDMLKELKTLFAQQAEQELLQTTRDFHSCKQEEGQSVSSYVLKMKGYIDNLERLGHPVTLGLAVSLILIGLRKEFDGFVQNYNMHSLGKTVNELHAMLKLHEQTLTLPKNNAPALHAIRAGKVQKVELLKKKKNASSGAGGSGIFTIELNTFLNRSWIYDTGCGTHICNTTQGLRASRKLKPGALSLYVGNGQREAVEASQTRVVVIYSISRQIRQLL
ncbi:hypothetical protein Tco_0830602 [Tanacetum coccineum]